MHFDLSRNATRSVFIESDFKNSKMQEFVQHSYGSTFFMRFKKRVCYFCLLKKKKKNERKKPSQKFRICSVCVWGCVFPKLFVVLCCISADYFKSSRNTRTWIMLWGLNNTENVSVIQLHCNRSLGLFYNLSSSRNETSTWSIIRSIFTFVWNNADDGHTSCFVFLNRCVQDVYHQSLWSLTTSSVVLLSVFFMFNIHACTHTVYHTYMYRYITVRYRAHS